MSHKINYPKKIMKRFNILFVIMTICLSLSGQERKAIRFTDRFADRPSQTAPVCAGKPNENINPYAGEIHYDTDGLLPDSIRICLDVAIDAWVKAMRFKQPPYLRICYDDLNSDVDVLTDVYPHSSDPSSDIYLPAALYRNIHNITTFNDDQIYDAIITLNKNKNWNCAHNESAPHGNSVNATTALMRAIGVALGFGTSVSEYKGRINFQFGGKMSVFDTKIFDSNGKRLERISNLDELANFVQPTGGRKIYVAKADNSHILYSPAVFEPNRSLVYLNNPNSLMHYDLGRGDMFQKIDDTTIDVLKSIGWETDFVTPLRIESTDVDADATASAYESHSFRLINNIGGNITDGNWKYELLDKDANYREIRTMSGTGIFTIPAIDNPNSYKVDINGNIKGRISFTGKLNGETVSARYLLSIGLPPTIKKIRKNGKLMDETGRYFTGFFTVEYLGCDWFTVSLEIDGDSGMRTRYILEPFLGHVAIDRIPAKRDSWIHISMSNSYGVAKSTIDCKLRWNDLDPLEPLFPGVDPIPGIIEDGTYQSDMPIQIEAYDINGNKVADGDEQSTIERLTPGLYFLRYMESGQCVKQVKYLKK